MDEALVLAGGLIAGYGMEKATKALIRRRSSEGEVNRFSGSFLHTLVWMTLNAACWLFIMYLGGEPVSILGLFAIISVCIMISAVDIATRKIPNELLAALVILQSALFIIDHQYTQLGIHLIGAALGFLLFLAPAFLGIGAGAGDVKFAAVVGLSLGFFDFFVAVVLMALFLLVYTAYLLLSKKGGLKTKVALGPFLAGAFIFVMAFDTAAQQTLFDALVNVM